MDAHVARGERWDVPAGHLDRVAADVVDVRALSTPQLVRLSAALARSSGVRVGLVLRTPATRSK